MIELTPAAHQAALALITDLYTQVIELRTQLARERAAHAEHVQRCDDREGDRP